MNVEARLRDSLRQRAESVDPAPDWDGLRTRIRGARRRRRQVLAGVFAVVVVAGAAVVAAWPEDGTRTDVRTDQPTDRPDDARSPDDAEDSDISSPVMPDDAVRDDLPPPPLEPRTVPVTVWTGREIVVWGGFLDGQNTGLPGPSVHYSDGAAYDPASRTWRTMSESPLPGGLDPPEWPPPPRGVWTGSELLVIQGGRAAAWDPATDRWRDVADPPADADTAGAAMTLDGTLDLVATGDEVIQLRPRSASAWDPVGDQWSPLPDPPIEIWQGAAVWTGDEILVLGTTSPSGYSGFPQPTEGAAYDPETRQWRTLPSTDLVRTATAAWTGSQVLVVDFDNTRTAAAYDPLDDEWRALPDVPLPTQEGISSVHMVDDVPLVWSFPGAAVLLDGDWYPLSIPDTAAHVIPGGDVLWVIGVDGASSPPAMTLSSFQPPLSVEEIPGSVLSIGFSNLRLPDDFRLESVDAGEEFIGDGVVSRVVAALAASRGSCEVTDRFGQPGDGETIDIDPVDEGEAFQAVRVEPGRIDFVESRTPPHVFEINCQEPADAEHLARHIVPTADV